MNKLLFTIGLAFLCTALFAQQKKSSKSATQTKQTTQRKQNTNNKQNLPVKKMNQDFISTQADGVYAKFETSKGTIYAVLEYKKTPLTIF